MGSCRIAKKIKRGETYREVQPLMMMMIGHSEFPSDNYYAEEQGGEEQEQEEWELSK